MPELGPEVLKRLAEWDSGGQPVSSLYVNVDGRRYPRKQDYLQRAQEVSHRLRHSAAALGRDALRAVERDQASMLEFLDSEFERGPTRGVALFSSSGAGLWEAVTATKPVRDRAMVAEQPSIVPLEAVLESYRAFCTVLVDRARARVFLTTMGRTEERTDVFDDVPGRHEQGGWAQARFQRHVDDHIARHLRGVADLLLAFFTDHEFDYLILGGPQEALGELEHMLHDYLSQRLIARLTLPLSASITEVMEAVTEIEQRMEEDKESTILEKLRAEASAGRNAVTGIPATLEALNEGRVQTLIVPVGLEEPGYRCESCGRLATAGGACISCGETMVAVADVLDSAVTAAIRQRSEVEAITLPDSTDVAHVGALLRY